VIHYNLDMIISLGYRIKSKIATNFRRWATERLKEYMSDYVEHLDNVLKVTGENLLEGAGSISHSQALAKANEEYQKYQIQNLSPVEEEYLLTIKDIEKQAKSCQ
jgi:hypothetical protein